MKNRLDLARFPRRANADSTHRARVSNAHCTRCTAKSHADPTRGAQDEAFLGIRCAIASSMREWVLAARLRNTGDWRSGSAGPLQGQGRGFKSLIAHHRIREGPSDVPTALFSSLSATDVRTNVSRETFATERDGRAPHPWRGGNFGAWTSHAAPIACRARRESARGAPAGPQARPRAKEPGRKRELRRTGPYARPRDGTRRNRTTKRQPPTSRPSGPNPSCRGWRRRPLPRGTGWPPSRTARSGGGTSRTARA